MSKKTEVYSYYGEALPSAFDPLRQVRVEAVPEISSPGLYVSYIIDLMAKEMACIFGLANNLVAFLACRRLGLGVRLIRCGNRRIGAQARANREIVDFLDARQGCVFS